MKDVCETAFEFYNCEQTGIFCSSEKKWINKIYQLKEKYPDEVDVHIRPEDNTGCMIAILPKKWFRIAPPRKMELTEEERRQRQERAQKARVAKAAKGGA